MKIRFHCRTFCASSDVPTKQSASHVQGITETAHQSIMNRTEFLLVAIMTMMKLDRSPHAHVGQSQPKSRSELFKASKKGIRPKRIDIRNSIRSQRKSSSRLSFLMFMSVSMWELYDSRSFGTTNSSNMKWNTHRFTRCDYFYDIFVFVRQTSSQTMTIKTFYG